MFSQSINRVACIGEVMVELIASDQNTAKLNYAGDTFNTAVYLKREIAGKECEIAYVTALGTDSFSKRITSTISDHGLDTAWIEHFDDKLPGLYSIDTDENGERSFSYWRSQSAARSLFGEQATLKPENLETCDLIYLSGITMAILPPKTRTQLIRFLKAFRKSGGLFAFDSNYRARLWENRDTAQSVTMELWSISDIALPSIDDEMELFGDNNEREVIARLTDAGVTCGALKRGAQGPIAIGQEPKTTTFTRITDIIDTTAAGDSFNAGFLAACITGKDMDTALQKGHDLASKVVQKRGAIVNF